MAADRIARKNDRGTAIDRALITLPLPFSPTHHRDSFLQLGKIAAAWHQPSRRSSRAGGQNG